MNFVLSSYWASPSGSSAHIFQVFGARAGTKYDEIAGFTVKKIPHFISG